MDQEHLTEARKNARTDSDAATIAWAQNRIEELEAALRNVIMYHDMIYSDSDGSYISEQIAAAREVLEAPRARTRARIGD